MDKIIFKGINQLAGNYRLLDNLMIVITKKARYVYVLILLFMWFRNNFNKKITLNACLSFVVTYIINFFIKIFYFKPRPFLKHGVYLLPPFPSKRNSSFPSKHTTLAFAVATSVLFYHRILGRVMWLIAILTGFSRIWSGQHYPSDIIKSSLLGCFTASFVRIVEPVWSPYINRIILLYNRMFSIDKGSSD